MAGWHPNTLILKPNTPTFALQVLNRSDNPHPFIIIMTPHDTHDVPWQIVDTPRLAYQKLLPRLPVPDLDDTLECLLETVHPLLLTRACASQGDT